MWRWDRERSARERFAAARAARDLVLDDAEVSPRQRVDVALECQRPVLGRPFPHIVEAVGDLLGGHPVEFLEHYVGTDVHPPRVILVPPRAAPDRRVVLVPGRGDGDRRRETHSSGYVIKEAVAHPHGLDTPAVAGLQTLDRKAVLASLAEVVRRADDHPVLRGPAAAW